MSAPLAIAVAIALVLLSAFFVAVEFALVSARTYRLEAAAHTSAAARAALRSARDLSLLLAGSQLGITLCTLGLGAVAKPAIHDLLKPALDSSGLPTTTADVLAFVLALTLVTFVHLVVGEMAPKSWAIAHPERSAILLALPMRAFMKLTRPLLLSLNGLANWCLARVGVEAVDEVATGRNPQALRELVDHSATTGALEPARRDQLLAALESDSAQIRTLARAPADIAGVQADDTVDHIRQVARTSRHLRLVVWTRGEPTGVVHVRDALGADDTVTATELMRPLFVLPADEPVADALETMRRLRSHFALVTDHDTLLGLITMRDLLDSLLPPRRPHRGEPSPPRRPHDP